LTLIGPDELGQLLVELAQSLRSTGVRIGTSELVHAERIARDYMTLAGQKKIGLDDLVFILVSAWPAAKAKEGLLRSEMERLLSSKSVERRAARIYEELRQQLETIGARPGDSVSLKRVVRGNKRERARIKAAYLRLRRVGAISRRRGREVVVDEARLRGIALRLAREGYETVDEAVRSGKRPARRDDMLLQMEAGIPVAREQLEGLSEQRLLRTGWDAVKKHDYRTQRLVADLLRERINRGEPVRDPEAIVEYLRRVDALSSDVLIGLLSRGEPVRGLQVDTIARVISGLPDDVAGRLLSKYRRVLGPEEYLRLLELSDPRKLWALEGRRIPGDSTGVYRALSLAARAYREALEYAGTLDPGRADMSAYYADRAMEALSSISGGGAKADRARSLVAAARRLVNAIDGFGPGLSTRSLVEAVAGLELEDAVVVMRNLYSRASTREEREILVSAMDRVLSRLVARSGLIPLGRRVISTRRGRLEVRRTIYNMVRLRPDPLVFYDRARSRPLGLALDVSSSMVPYSSWALAVASIFSRHVERIVLFSHEATVYQGPFTRREIARILLEAEFGGRTDIGLGLRAASERLGARRIVAVTDLSQTVDGEPPWETVSVLRRSGVRIVFITHDRHDREARRMLEAEQARVLVASSPREAAARIIGLLR